MQVSTRMSYPDPGPSRQRSKLWTASPGRADERGGGHRGTLPRTPHQSINARPGGGSADKEVFVARALSSTLAMLQMHVVPDTTEDSDPLSSAGEARTSEHEAFVRDLFSDILTPRHTQ